jgi:hypothetical protein
MRAWSVVRAGVDAGSLPRPTEGSPSRSDMSRGIRGRLGLRGGGEDNGDAWPSPLELEVSRANKCRSVRLQEGCRPAKQCRRHRAVRGRACECRCQDRRSRNIVVKVPLLRSSAGSALRYVCHGTGLADECVEAGLSQVLCEVARLAFHKWASRRDSRYLRETVRVLRQAWCTAGSV